ncbi:methyltransferase [Polaromonas eurypsychrophila]|uniref:SAM-dependent methyltransferase n=1 Tax=Polaromonas eurypsychrophila TaxID=1614635 RepID=A0A916WGJ9_9BURK|nr:class I SAM-dependent methyltransferase [Polaromonas eurypsychrophila]GGA98872.1 SAM-dependent methyltransferase [Polaromonas eurypsychrophila]
MLTPDGGATFDAALRALLQHLREQAYEFTTVTPLTHARVLANRQGIPATNLRDIFGWSLGFSERAMPAALLDLLLLHGLVLREDTLYRSRVRVASFDGDLFVHSAFPTLANDAVFFGPDTYRFLNLIRDHIPVAAAGKPLRIADVGCGSGAGGILAARLRVGAQVTLNDINPLALRYAGINSASAGVDVELAAGDALSAVTGDFDVVLSNPPYLEDDAGRAYRHGGGDLGRALSVKIGAQALQRLLPCGRLILYTGVAIVNGVDHFIREMEPFLGQAGCTYTYAEIDPDVFGEELERTLYRQADRIAAVGLVAVKA